MITLRQGHSYKRYKFLGLEHNRVVLQFKNNRPLRAGIGVMTPIGRIHYYSLSGDWVEIDNE